ncbi:hypothetical protein [Terriglobus sp. TAA 43]|uniref:hypothetical protein n=1 Tax=Terriglobus sp. TAA 43 TaxID=278961 RepID=UPI000646787D|nr:hypothetical protein [Terriglobus sp. TAA 43]
MKRWLILVALVGGFGGVASAQQQHKDPESVLMTMAVAAKEAGVPAGIVLRKGSDICHERGASAEPLPTDPMQRLRMIADQYGYHVDESGPVLLVTPKDGVPDALNEALQHRWERFPAQNSVMREMGMILNGWMGTVADPKRAFGIDSISNSEEEVVHLPASENLSSEEIADRIVSLGSKGFWIAWQNPPEIVASQGLVRLSTFSYRDDFVNAKRYECK